MRKTHGKMGRGHELDTVGVVGSIPIAPTIRNQPVQSKIIEIPEEFEVVPAVRWNNDRPSFFRTLISKSEKRREKSVSFLVAASRPFARKSR